jgi:hypothetical protein
VGNGQDHGAAERALDQLLVEMVTINPARSVRWDDHVGSIEAGKVADLVVIDAPVVAGNRGIPDSPYRKLIDATEQHVSLVMVGGVAQAGDVAVMAALKPGDYEIVSGGAGCFEKAIDVTQIGVPKGHQTLVEVSTLLADALRALGGDHALASGGPSSPFANTWSYLKARVPGGAALPDLIFNFGLAQFFPAPGNNVNLESIALPPLFTVDDDWWFATLENARDESSGLTAATAPYGAYPSNANQLIDGESPFAAPVFRDRWYGACHGR